MADTIRYTSELLALMPTGTPDGISAQDQRDHVMSSMPNIRYGGNISATATLNSDYDCVVLSGTGTYTVTLPSAASMIHHQITFKKTGASGTVTIDPNASETIDGATTYTMNTQWQKVTIWSDGTQWLILHT